MPTFSHAAGHIVAADIREAFAGIDGALLNTARLVVSVLEAQSGADLAAVKGQRLFDALASSFNKVVEGRKDMVSAHRTMVTIKNESNLAVYDYGCLGDGPLFAEAGEPVRAAA